MKFKFKKIEKIEQHPFSGDVYDLEVENDHSYNIEGVIVHNSLCSTRRVTGHGIPQLSAILLARRTLYSLRTNVRLIADGGIRTSGDVVKALAAGADSVMVGNIFAGTDEAPGELISREDGSQSKKYRGQSSKNFLEDRRKFGVAAEGEHTYVPYKGSVGPIIDDLLAGVRSGMTYSGVRNLKDLYNNSNFICVSNHSFREGMPHGLE